MQVRVVAIALAVALAGCSAAPARVEAPPAEARPSPPSTSPSSPSAPACTGTLRVRFFDVAQGLAALVELPGGQRILVDTGDARERPECEGICERAHDHLLSALAPTGGLDLLWITHQHSDHLGGAAAILSSHHVAVLVDNGLDRDKRAVSHMHEVARARGTAAYVVDPAHREVPLRLAPDVRLRSIVPPAWPAACATNANDCSIGLRVDYCASSIAFVGDAESAEEATMDLGGQVTVLQVGHHGSTTSTSAALLERAQPKYAVISAGRPNEGLNATYCHPRAATLARLNRALGGDKGGGSVRAFDGKVACKGADASHWLDVPTSPRLWATERDGDVTLSTKGDGVFVREE